MSSFFSIFQQQADCWNSFCLNLFSTCILSFPFTSFYSESPLSLRLSLDRHKPFLHGILLSSRFYPGGILRGGVGYPVYFCSRIPETYWGVLSTLPLWMSWSGALQAGFSGLSQDLFCLPLLLLLINPGHLWMIIAMELIRYFSIKVFPHLSCLYGTQALKLKARSRRFPLGFLCVTNNWSQRTKSWLTIWRHGQRATENIFSVWYHLFIWETGPDWKG